MMRHTPMKPSSKPMKRSPFNRTGMLRGTSAELSARAKRKPMKSKQRAVTKEEKLYWNRLATEVGCIACRIDDSPNFYVSIHHVDGRTKPGCHMKVLPLCAEHHQQDDTDFFDRVAVHPNKAAFEMRYGMQENLIEICKGILREQS
jgi:hypothetical protein